MDNPVANFEMLMFTFLLDSDLLPMESEQKEQLNKIFALFSKYNVSPVNTLHIMRELTEIFTTTPKPPTHKKEEGSNVIPFQSGGE